MKRYENSRILQQKAAGFEDGLVPVTKSMTGRHNTGIRKRSFSSISRIILVCVKLIFFINPPFCKATEEGTAGYSEKESHGIRELQDLKSKDSQMILKAIDPGFHLEMDASNDDIKLAWNSILPKVHECKVLELTKAESRTIPRLIIENLINLEELNISNAAHGHELLRCFPKEQLEKQLVVLRAAKCPLDANSFKVISQCKSLKILDLSGIYLRRGIDSREFTFDCLKDTLIELRVRACGLNAQDLAEVEKCISLKVLDISYNKLRTNETTNGSPMIDIILNIYRAITDLLLHWLSFILPLQSRHSRPLFGSLGGHLVELYMSNSYSDSAGLSIDDLSEIFQFTHLMKLNISGNWFGKLPDSFAFGEAVLNGLTHLNISNCYFDHQILLEINRCKQLRALSMSSNDLSRLPSGFEFSESICQSLVNVAVSHCSLSIEAITPFTELRCVKRFDMSNNNIGRSKEIFSFGYLSPTLTELNMQGCHFNHKMLHEVAKCPRLQKLNITYMNLSRIPEDFSFGNAALTLEILLMSECRLNGRSFSQIVSGLQGLVRLDASFNDLSDLSEDFDFKAVMPHLNHLKVRSCRLSQRIVDEEEKLNRLAVFSDD